MRSAAFFSCPQTRQFTFQLADEDFDIPVTDDGFKRVPCFPTATTTYVDLSSDEFNLCYRYAYSSYLQMYQQSIDIGSISATGRNTDDIRTGMRQASLLP